MKTLISPSILSADFSDIANACKKLQSCGADWIHYDVMDGNFVPNITFGMKFVKDCQKHTSLPADVHLMIDKPERYVEQFVSSGAYIVTFHYESTSCHDLVIEKIRNAGAKVGISINPETAVEAVLPYLDKIDMVLVMTVRPGFGGQKLIVEATNKISVIKKSNPNVLVQVDGGVTAENVKDLLNKGADVIVAGSSVFNATDMALAIKSLRG